MNYLDGARAKLFAVLFFFSSAIGLLWLGLITGPELFRVSGWYIGATAFAILGVIFLILSGSGGRNEERTQG